MIGSIAPHGISSESVERAPSILTSKRHRQRRFADRREHAGVALDVDLAAHELGAAELVPGDRQLVHDRVEHATREHPVDLGQMALGGRL